MGMFDTFWGEYRCISCATVNTFEEQTRNYDCMLYDFFLGDYLDKGNANYYYEFEVVCPDCHNKQTLCIAIRRGQYVGVYHKEDADKTNILDLDNIEDGYQRRLDRERDCREKVGFECESLTSEYEVKHVGEYICALENEWRVCGVYKSEGLPPLFSDKYVYLTTDETDIRIITERINIANEICRSIYRIDCESLDDCTDDDVFAVAKEHYIDGLERIE